MSDCSRYCILYASVALHHAGKVPVNFSSSGMMHGEAQGILGEQEMDTSGPQSAPHLRRGFHPLEKFLSVSNDCSEGGCRRTANINAGITVYSACMCSVGMSPRIISRAAESNQATDY